MKVNLVLLKPILWFLKTYLAVLAIFLASFMPASAQKIDSIDNVRIGDHKKFTRIVLNLSKEVPFKVRSLTAPYRIYIDFYDIILNLRKSPPPGTGLILGVRYGQLPNGAARVVFDTNGPARVVRAHYYPAQDKNQQRLVLDLDSRISVQDYKRRLSLVLATGDLPSVKLSKLEKKGQIGQPDPPDQIKPVEAFTETTSKIAKPSHTKPPSRTNLPGPMTPSPSLMTMAGLQPKPIRPVSAPGRNRPHLNPLQPLALSLTAKTRAENEIAFQNKPKRMIIIDPGHGGIDPGAIGVRGLREKDFTLTMSQELRDMLLATGRYAVRLTRDSDSFVRLRERVAMARHYAQERQSDQVLFVSVHADSIRKARVKGMSVYTLSEKGSDAETEALARRENRADLVAGHDLSEIDSLDVTNILVDMALEESKRVASNFSKILVAELQAARIRLLPRAHRSAGFAVLKAPDIPSVLVELGYLSNSGDERLLRNPAHRRKLAQALVRSIDRHFDGLKIAVVR